MSRKSLFLTSLIVVVLAAGIGAGLWLLFRHEPDFYVRAAVPSGQQRTQWNDEFESKFFNSLLGGIVNLHDWGADFTQEQINSYLAQDYLTKHSTENPLPEGISEPRIVFEPDHLRLGFRYGVGPWNTVVSLKLRVWLVARELNTVALEVESLRAGALPISAESLLQRIADFVHRKDIDPIWYRRNGHPVLIVRFQADRTPQTFQLQRLDLEGGITHISGRSLENTPPTAPGLNTASFGGR